MLGIGLTFIMSHDQLDYQKLGMMIAEMTKRDVKEQALSYLSECMNALKFVQRGKTTLIYSASLGLSPNPSGQR